MSDGTSGIGTTVFFFGKVSLTAGHGEYYLFAKVSLARVILTAGGILPALSHPKRQGDATTSASAKGLAN